MGKSSAIQPFELDWRTVGSIGSLTIGNWTRYGDATEEQNQVFAEHGIACGASELILNIEYCLIILQSEPLVRELLAHFVGDVHVLNRRQSAVEGIHETGP